jgi:uncharacterized protein (TIGR01777 family)
MKVVMPGGSGQVGTVLARAFHRDGHEVVVLSRSPRMAPWLVVPWDGVTTGAWTKEFRGADAIINLAGRNVNCRYSARNRHLIMDSRIESTRVVGRVIAASSPPPRVWLQASTATIYAHRYDAPNDEEAGMLGGGEPGAPDRWRFSTEVAMAWEREVDRAVTPDTRKVRLRAAAILSPDRGGIFDTLLAFVRRGLGGRAGDGRQYVSWIHDRDFVRAIYWLIEHDGVAGAVNVAVPHPLPNAEFMRELRKAWGARVGLPATRWMLEIAALVLRTETELVLKSRRVVPGTLTKHGFAFDFPLWAEAARDLCRRWRDLQAGRRDAV